jgi:serine/threonine protein kinase
VRSCQRCGAPLHAAGDADALCPACLLQLALDAAPADSADLADDAFGGSEAEGTPRCRVIGMLGGGAHGRTYLAETEDGAKLPRFVALKRPDAEVAAPDAHARLLEEQRRVARVNHPAFAKMLEAGVASGRPYFLFEYIRGLPIRMYCDRRRLGVDARLALVEAVAAAMADAHRAGLAHGALSASNIVITGASGPLASRILDLGERQALAAAGASGIARPTAEDDLRDLAELRQVLTAGV